LYNFEFCSVQIENVFDVPNSKLSSELLASISCQCLWTAWQWFLQSIACYFVEKQVPGLLLLLRTIFFKLLMLYLAGEWKVVWDAILLGTIYALSLLISLCETTIKNELSPLHCHWLYCGCSTCSSCRCSQWSHI
jgi:hypothetical protein